MPRIAEFKSRHPSILFEITENHGDLDPRALAACDFTTRIGMGDWSDVRMWRLARERLFALASPLYAQAHPECMALETLPRANLLHASEAQRSRMGWTEWFAATGTPYSSAPDVLFSDHHSAIHAALVGQGVTLGWEHLVGGYLSEGRLMRVAETVVETDQSVYLVSPRNRVLQPHHELFRDWIVDTYSREATRAENMKLFQSDARMGG